MEFKRKKEEITVVHNGANFKRVSIIGADKKELSYQWRNPDTNNQIGSKVSGDLEKAYRENSYVLMSGSFSSSTSIAIGRPSGENLVRSFDFKRAMDFIDGGNILAATKSIKNGFDSRITLRDCKIIMDSVREWRKKNK